MKKTILALALFSSVPSVYPADFSIEQLKLSDIGAVPGASAAPVPAGPAREEAQVPQDLVAKFNQAGSDLRYLAGNTTWVRFDLDRLENTARRIAQTNAPDPFFQNELQRKAWDISRYASDAQAIGLNIKNLLSLAQRSAELNKTARDIDMEARTLLSRAQFDIENSAQRLEWAVRSAKPEIIGYNAQWNAMDISRNARDFTWKVRDISFDAQSLVSKTQP